MSLNQLTAVETADDIPAEHRNSPTGDLLAYHNLAQPPKDYNHPVILISMCMDFRKQLRIPPRFAYILRSGGGRIDHQEFYLAYAIAVGGIRTVVLMAHNHCAMTRAAQQETDFVSGLVAHAGWKPEDARRFYHDQIDTFAIQDAVSHTLEETLRLRAGYPGILFTPLFYNLDNQLLYLIDE